MAWTSKTKNAASTPTFKVRIPTRVNRGFLVTPDNNFILVGLDEDKILLFQEAGTSWNFDKDKTAGIAWSHKVKNPII